MNRRGFLAALAGLPFVGKLFGKEKPLSYAEKGYPRIYGRSPSEEDMLEDIERLKRVTRLERIDMSCLSCGYKTVINLPSGTFRQGILKTQKFVCVDCSMKRLED